MSTAFSFVKRNCISLETKLKILDEIDKRRSYKTVALEFGVSKSCVAGVHRNRDFIHQLKPVRHQVNLNRKRLRLAKHPELELALLAWVKVVRSVDEMALTGPLLAEKAISLAKELNISDFKASEGWLARFKDRNFLKFRHSTNSTAAHCKSENRNLSGDLSVTVHSYVKDDNYDLNAKVVSYPDMDFNFLFSNHHDDDLSIDNNNVTSSSAINEIFVDEIAEDENESESLNEECYREIIDDDGKLPVEENSQLIPCVNDAKVALIILRRFLTTKMTTPLDINKPPPFESLEILENFVDSCKT